MSLPFLIYCSLLKKAQYRQLRELSNVQSGAVDMASIDQAMRDGVERRLTLAQEFLSFTEGLVSSSAPGDEITNRNIISRAYYAVHHAVRALLLFEERGDVDGHRESIEAVCALLKRNPAARSRLGNTEEFRASFLDLLDRRHLADYYPYGTNAPNEAPLDFAQSAKEAAQSAKEAAQSAKEAAQSAKEAAQSARRVVEKTQEYITMKEAGII